VTAPHEVVAALTAAGRTLAVAESLTGGAVCDALVGVPGASACLRGGVVAYATDVKASVLGVPAGLLERHGAVHPEVALAMAAGVRALLGADLGVGTTGVAGPDPQDGHRPGDVWVAVAGPELSRVERLGPGPVGEGRAGVRARTVALALRLVLDSVTTAREPDRRLGRPGDPGA
jgi:nicotinamide-nucleotide amidase